MTLFEDLSSIILASVSRHAPKVRVSRLSIEPKIDSLGDESLRVKLVIQKRPADRAAFREQLLRVVDDTRTALTAEGDQRFPYFEVASEQDEKEKKRELERLRAG